jgi:ribonuclease MRP protein subunit RMP1
MCKLPFFWTARDGLFSFQMGDQELARRAVWESVGEIRLMRTHRAFSQLAADNQFATLGLVLLGVLAQVNTACVHLVGERAETDGLPTTPAEPIGSSKKKGQLRASGGVAADDDTVDRGQVVSREEVARSGKLLETTEGPPAKRKTKGAGDVPPSQKKEQQNVVPKEDKATVGKEKSAKKKKNKGKKGKSGDEFDDLFSSLF